MSPYDQASSLAVLRQDEPCRLARERRYTSNSGNRAVSNSIRSRGVRTFNRIRSSNSRSTFPARTMRTGGIRSPSWKISTASFEIEPLRGCSLILQAKSLLSKISQTGAVCEWVAHTTNA